jgi:TRAP-type C4-dicarboxylate transport system substrate-binding protein
MLRRWIGLASLAIAAVGLAGHAHAQEQWKLGSLMQPPSFGAMLDKEFLQTVNTASNGKLVVDHQFVANEQEMVQQVVRGRLQMGATSAFGAGVTIPDATVVSLPYVWSSEAERRYVTDKFAFPVLKQLFAEKGLELLAIHEAGYNGVFCKFACDSVASLKGVKARVSPAAASKIFWQSLGANGVSLPISELWPGLEQNLVLAADQPFPFYSVTPGAQSAPHFVATQHLHHPWMYFANKAAWDSLPEDVRKAAVAGLPDANTVRDRWFAEERKKFETFTGKGGKIYLLNDAQRGEWQKLVEPTLLDWVKGLTPGAKRLFEEIQKGKKEFAAMRK